MAPLTHAIEYAPHRALDYLRGIDLRQPAWKAILTDIQFWLPVAVLAIGIGLLAAMR
jgi:hypothetical protein